MKAVRTVASALAIVAGAVLVAGWALASVAIQALEDETTVRAMTERALDSPAVTNAIADDLGDSAVAALADLGLDPAELGLDGPLRQVVSQAVDSQQFRDAVLSQVDSAHRQFMVQLAEPDRGPAPLAVSIDLSDTVNTRINDLGGLVGLLPEITVPPLSIQVLDAEQSGQARDSYGTMRWVHSWGLWLGIGVLLGGAAVSHRRRWFAAKAFLALGVMCLGFSGALALVGPEALVGWLPGEDGGTWKVLWQDVIGEDASAALVSRSLLVGAVAMAGAVVAAAIGLVVTRRHR